MRIRQEAQFALAERKATGELGQVALNSKNLLARLHAFWGLGQVGRQASAAEKIQLTHDFLWPVLDDPSAEVKAQAVKVLGELKQAGSLDKLVPLLKDESPRVRFFAAQSLGEIGADRALGPILEMLRDNADKDAYLRHAGMLALARIGDRKALIDSAKDGSPAVRMAVLLAMRRLKMPEIAGFLGDADPLLVMEAARAIHDEPMPEALPQLAALAGRTGLPAAFTYRCLNALFRLGQKEDAVALALYAAQPTAPEAMRLEALRHLSAWANPSTLDRVTGLYYPLPARTSAPAVEAMRLALGGIFTGSGKVQGEAARVAAKLGIKEVGPALLQIVSAKDRPAQVRVEGLKALAALKDSRLPEAMKLALESDQPALRAEGRRVLARQNPEQALTELEKALDKGAIIEKQGALDVLGSLKHKQADAILSQWLDRLLQGEVTPELRLDLLEAAGKRAALAVKTKLAEYEGSRAKQDDLAKYREVLFGGNAESGRRLFLEKSELSCVRCHKINGVGGEVGPDLSHIGKDHKREYLLESIVLPSKQIAKGYDSVALVLIDGRIVTGILKTEDAKQVRLMTPEGALVTVPRDQIADRVHAKSAMPEDLIQHLSRRELRDLVEFLSNLR
jgi:quinoprotein glucose dehydrogenase